MSVFADPKLQTLADALHAKSVAQEAETGRYFSERAKRGELSWDGLDADSHRFMADKLVALEPVKAEFCHLLCRSLQARRIVEVGTSYGVSTLYLADAVRENGGGTVIATEHEPTKAAAARETFAQAGLSDLIDLREGDLRETLKVIEGPVDFVLVDIWVEMARPALELIAPHLRQRAGRRRQHRPGPPRLPTVLRIRRRPEEPPEDHDPALRGRSGVHREGVSLPLLHRREDDGEGGSARIRDETEGAQSSNL